MPRATALSLLPRRARPGGCLNQAALDLSDEVVRRSGGTTEERQAFRTYWRQRIARGVADVISRRTPFCTGAHWPLQAHHFSHIPDMGPPAHPPQAGVAFDLSPLPVTAG